MDDRTWERYGALGGIWFFVLTLVGALIGGSPPMRSDSPAEIEKYFADNDTAIQVGAFLTALAVIGLVWWFGSLWKAMTRAEAGAPRVATIALIGLLMSGIGAVIGFTLNAGTAAAIDVAGQGSAIFLHISSVAFGFSATGDLIMAAAVGGLILRSGFLPKWVAYVSYLVVALAVLAMIGIASDSDAFTWLGMIEAIVWGIWIMIIGVLNYRELGTDSGMAT